MADVFSKKKRSEIMSHIRSKDTVLEQDFLKLLSSVSHAAGYRYRKHYMKLPGKPDAVFPAKKIAVFIDGCFWHGCPSHSRTPLSNSEYWEQKIARNRDRDREVTKACKKQGWRVIRIWEHDAKKRPGLAVAKIMKSLELS